MPYFCFHGQCFFWSLVGFKRSNFWFWIFERAWKQCKNTVTRLHCVSPLLLKDNTAGVTNLFEAGSYFSDTESCRRLPHTRFCLIFGFSLILCQLGWVRRFSAVESVYPRQDFELTASFFRSLASIVMYVKCEKRSVIQVNLRRSLRKIFVSSCFYLSKLWCHIFDLPRISPDLFTPIRHKKINTTLSFPLKHDVLKEHSCFHQMQLTNIAAFINFN